MITLYGFGSAFGLPDPSPFVTKVEILLKMAGLPYQMDTSGAFSKAPKGKIPFIRDGEEVIGDSTLIRFHLEQTYGVNFDAQAKPESLGTAWLAEKYCEESLYFFALGSRWLDEANFNKGTRRFFDRAPALIRPFIIRKVRGYMRRRMIMQGTGLHSQAEQVQLVARGMQALSQALGQADYFGGDAPCGADASIAPFLLGMTCPYFTTPFTASVTAHANLIAYRDRMMARFYPDFTLAAS